MIKKNFFSILVVLIIMYLSLANSEKFTRISLLQFSFSDKIIHFLMYFFLMSVIILENRKNIRNNIYLFLIALIPFTYGVMMEILQAKLTTSRTGSFYDALSDTTGILASLLLWLFINAVLKGTIKKL